MLRRLILTAAVMSGAIGAAPAVSAVQACPMCKLANEEGTESGTAAAANARPRAYMYSILFMLAMPATLLSAFGVSFYRLHRKQQALPSAGDSPEFAAEGAGA